LRLFKHDDPFRLLETRQLESGLLEIGRDPEVGWPLDDPERAISRRHCVLALQEGRLTLQDTSANGVYIGPERRRAPFSSPVQLSPGEAFRFGPYMIAVDRPRVDAEPRCIAGPAGGAGERAKEAPGMDRDLDVPVPAPRLVAKRTLAAPAVGGELAPPSGSLLDAFCAGAGLDPSSFLDEDPTQVMQRVGAVYQRMVLGLTELMNERTALKSDHELERTTVHASGNNPFRWASAERVALDLLRARSDGFLSGAAAVESAFVDLTKHLRSMLGGFKGALSATLASLSPASIEAHLEGRSLVLKNRKAMAWQTYVDLHRRLSLDQADVDGPISRGFQAGYEGRLQELEQRGAS
jgi:predicted component of type VI protein secretion system